MKTTIKAILIFAGLSLGGMLSAGMVRADSPRPSSVACAGQTPRLSGSGRSIRPSGDVAVDDNQTRQLDAIFAATSKAAAALPPGGGNAAQRRTIESDLRTQLNSFVAAHPGSVWTPGVQLWLAHASEKHSAYLDSMDHYRQAWLAVKGSTTQVAQQMGLEASGNMARLLALSGKLDEFNAFQVEVARTLKGEADGSDWDRARQSRAWVTQHPSESHKCGISCLEQLGLLVQNGQPFSRVMLETESSTNGFSVADLVQLGAKAGLRIHAASVTDFAKLPVPAVVHLRSEHFILVQERRGDSYDIYDPAALRPQWISAADLAREASGAVVLGDAHIIPSTAQLKLLNMVAAAMYRGGGFPTTNGPDQNGPGPACPDPSAPPDTCANCPPGPSPGPGHGPGPGPGPGPGHGPGPGPGPGNGPGPGPCGKCSVQANGVTYNQSSGMPTWSVTEPWLTPVITDTPLTYNTAYGPPITLRVSYNARHTSSLGVSDYSHGAQLGNVEGAHGLWACGWFSYGELNWSGSEVNLLLPTGEWALFQFSGGSTNSDMNFMHNVCLSKIVVGGNVTGLVMHNADGSLQTYGVLDSSDPSYAGLFYLSSIADAVGNQTTLAYDVNFCLTSVTATDGTAFTLNYTNLSLPAYVTSVTASYGATVSFSYDTNNLGVLVGITDAAGIKSQFSYASTNGGVLTHLITPYGTTVFDLTEGGVFDRVVKITEPDGSVEFYGSVNSYSGGGWPDFSAGQIPTNTPLGTLDSDSGKRQVRNTFYWNAHQFAPYLSTSYSSFNWSIFKQGRIRHWLADPTADNTEYNALSWAQMPSADGSAEGQLTWYDYAGKPVDYQAGTQIMASVIAMVLPDGTTWYQNYQFTANGLATNMVEKWVVNGADNFRTNIYVYDPNGIDLIAMTNALNVQVSSNVFNAYHEVTTNYDALNEATVYTYAATTLQLTSITRPTGLVTTNIYDGSHRLQKSIDLQITRTNGFTWNTDGTLRSHTDELGLVVTNFWDGLNRLTGIRYPDGTTTSNLYHRVDNTAYPNSTGTTNVLDLTASKDRLGYWTYFVYDPLRRKIAATNANHVVTCYGYCDCGALTYVTNAYGTPVQAVTQFVYDNQSRLTETVFPEGSTLANAYDSLGRTTIVTDGLGSTTNNYDNLGRLLSVSNYYGQVLAIRYDQGDRATNTKFASGVSVTNTYDNLSRAVLRDYTDGGKESFVYSARGLVLHTNQLTNVTANVFDAAKRKIFETNANHEVSQFIYDPAGNITNLLDGRGERTTWTYDVFGMVSNKVDDSGNILFVYHYDADKRLTNRWSAAKGNTYYSFDAIGNCTSIQYPSSPSISLAYDALNRNTNMVDAVGTTSYGYDAAGQILSEDGPWNNDTVTYTYNDLLRSNVSIQQPNSDAWTQNYNYDSARRLTNAVSPAGSFTYTYDTVRHMNVGKLLLPNGAYITNAYDGMGQLLSTELANSSGSQLNFHGYSYNVGGERTKQTRTAGDYINYTYDKIGQLIAANGTEADTTTQRLQEQFGYGYDAAHNLNLRTNYALVESFTVNNLNELSNMTHTGAMTVAGTTMSAATSVTINSIAANRYSDATFAKDGFTVINGTNTFTAIAADALGRHSTNTINAYLPATNNCTYDLNGNLLYDGLRAFAYDDENQLISVTVSNAWQSHFVYDGKMRRRITQEFTWQSGSWVQTNEVHYIYDGLLVVQERDINNLPSVTYTRGKDIKGTLQKSGGIGGLLARTDQTSGTTAFYHADGNGNVTAMINSQQVIVARYLYDPFGNIISKSGLLADVNLYRFSSKEYHVNSGLIYYLLRFYDPTTQRWLNRDPINEKGGFNLFTFAGNNPISLFDVFGLDCDSEKAAVDAAQRAVNNAQRGVNSAERALNDANWGVATAIAAAAVAAVAVIITCADPITLPGCYYAVAALEAAGLAVVAAGGRQQNARNNLRDARDALSEAQDALAKAKEALDGCQNKTKPSCPAPTSPVLPQPIT